MVQPSHFLPVPRSLKVGTDRDYVRVKHKWGQSHCSHLLNDPAAERHVSTTEDVRHVPRHLQVILAIHTWDLGDKGDHMRQVTPQPSSLLLGQTKWLIPKNGSYCN